MQQVLGGLKSTVGGVHQEMKTELDEIQKEVKKIDNVCKGLNTIKLVFCFYKNSLSGEHLFLYSF